MVGLNLFLLLPRVSFGQETDDGQPVTAEEKIPVEIRRVKVRPLGVDQLQVELDAWLAMLKARITEVGKVEIEIQQGSRHGG